MSPGADLDAESLVDGNNLEEEGKVALVREVAQRQGLRGKVVLQRTGMTRGHRVALVVSHGRGKYPKVNKRVEQHNLLDYFYTCYIPVMCTVFTVLVESSLPWK